MHILRTTSVSLEEDLQAVDLGQTPADIVFLSFSDSDLAAVAAAFRDAGQPSLRLAALAQLKHPYSVDLYIDAVCRRARLVVVRLLGGFDYWRYGAEQLAAAARRHGFRLALLPGDHVEDARLDAASTLSVEDLRRLWAYFQEGGAENMQRFRRALGMRTQGDAALPEPQPIPAFARFPAACRDRPDPEGRALLVFYRALRVADDTTPIEDLADALRARGLAVTTVSVTSLKDPTALADLATLIAAERPDIVLNTTAFSARLDDRPGILESADAPVLQAVLAGSGFAQWQASERGLGAADLAMNVVLPELDGRLLSRAISFKAEAERHEALQFTVMKHRSEASRIGFTADLAARWARLRHQPKSERRIACILSDYPGRGGREGYAVGLDTAASVTTIAETLREAGYDIGALPASDRLMRELTKAPEAATVALASYRLWFASLPAPLRAAMTERWGAPEDDLAVESGNFVFRVLQAGKFWVAMQPDRGRRPTRKGDYHDTTLPPCHAYAAFYLWLRQELAIDAMIHCGAHGTLEWLPGKVLALSADCAPEALLGATPVLYPFILNNPGEAAQAKRRLSAVTIGHLTPPLVAAGSHGAAAELETLLDEYAQAQTLDARRATRLAKAILEKAEATKLLHESGAAQETDLVARLGRLDAWLCDLKEMRIRDGLHVFGRDLDAASRRALAEGFAGAPDAAWQSRIDGCAAAERSALLAGLEGRFVPPGPAGAPSRGRLDVLPTGRNLTSIDPRAVPTRTAWDLGRRLAAEIMTRHGQDHGEWPRAIVMDLWGSATMRTGGDEIAQAMALLGVKPCWDMASARVIGFEVLPPAALDHPRVDVTLRVSGLFRDVFATQIGLLDQAVRAVAALDEEDDVNPLAAARRAGRFADAARIFGAAPGAYGVGLSRAIDDGAWRTRADLGTVYLDATSHAYAGPERDARAAPAAFRDRVAAADAFVHVQDMAEQDLLDADAFAEHEGGFAAAAASLGRTPALYHADTSTADAPKVRTLRDEIARVVRGRAANPRWIAGQMRHHHRGAAEIAATLDNLFLYAATTDAVRSDQFDLYYDATFGDPAVRTFLFEANPAAAQAMIGRFAEARERGLWHVLRNSVAADLGALEAVA